MNKQLSSTTGAILILLVPLGLSRQALAFQACVNKKSGATRILLNGGNCKNTETSIILGSSILVVDSNAQTVGKRSLPFSARIVPYARSTESGSHYRWALQDFSIVLARPQSQGRSFSWSCSRQVIVPVLSICRLQRFLVRLACLSREYSH